LGEGGMWEDLFTEKFIIREENFPEGGVGFSKHYLKKFYNEKINKKVVFSWK